MGVGLCVNTCPKFYDSDTAETPDRDVMIILLLAYNWLLYNL